MAVFQGCRLGADLNLKLVGDLGVAEVTELAHVGGARLDEIGWQLAIAQERAFGVVEEAYKIREVDETGAVGVAVGIDDVRYLATAKIDAVKVLGVKRACIFSGATES